MTRASSSEDCGAFVCARKRKASDPSDSDTCLPEAVSHGRLLLPLPMVCCICTAAGVQTELGTQPFACLLNPHPFSCLMQRTVLLLWGQGTASSWGRGMDAWRSRTLGLPPRNTSYHKLTTSAFLLLYTCGSVSSQDGVHTCVQMCA